MTRVAFLQDAGRWADYNLAMTTASGPFQVKVQTEPPYSELEGVVLARARFDKRFEGALDATSEVQMLGISTPDPKVRAYVAVERIVGTLDGKRGSFVVTQHGVMSSRGVSLAVPIVEGTGTGELRGITGEMKIRIEPGGAHFYELEYTLPA